MQKALLKQSVIVWLIAFLSFSSQGYAQGTGPEKITIEGTVIDNNNNEPIVGATVRLKSGPKGTATNADGKFIIAGCSPTDVFQVTYIGYKPKEFTVGKKRNFNIYLEENATQLDQVVVTGFQELKKNSFTGTATIVTKED